MKYIMCENIQKGSFSPLTLIFCNSSHLFLYIFISPLTPPPVSLPSVAEGGEDTDAAIRTFLNACRLSSPAPAGPLTGTVAVDGPRSRRLNLAGLIGRETFSRRERTSEGLRLRTGGYGRRTINEELLLGWTLAGPGPQITARGRCGVSL